LCSYQNLVAEQVDSVATLHVFIQSP